MSTWQPASYRRRNRHMFLAALILITLAYSFSAKMDGAERVDVRDMRGAARYQYQQGAE